jgi:hypothetical protein
MTLKLKTPEDCPNYRDHTPTPGGYVERFEWAIEMGRTHKQTKCAGCGLYAIWIPLSPLSPDKQSGAEK